MRTLPLHLFNMFAFAVAARKVVDLTGFGSFDPSRDDG